MRGRGIDGREGRRTTAMLLRPSGAVSVLPSLFQRRARALICFLGYLLFGFGVPFLGRARARKYLPESIARDYLG